MADPTELLDAALTAWQAADVLLHELRPDVTDRFACFWLMVHEYDSFRSAWS